MAVGYYGPVKLWATIESPKDYGTIFITVRHVDLDVDSCYSKDFTDVEIPLIPRLTFTVFNKGKNTTVEHAQSAFRLVPPPGVYEADKVYVKYKKTCTEGNHKAPEKYNFGSIIPGASLYFTFHNVRYLAFIEMLRKRNSYYGVVVSQLRKWLKALI